MARVEFDTSELERWSDVLATAPARARAGGRALVSKGSLNIKTEARRNAPGSGTAKYYPASINYDVEETPLEIVGEIGPVRGRRQWGLGNIFEYGTSDTPPMPHIEPALDHEEPKFVAAAEVLAGGAVDGGLRI